jgi:hypothetical protein
MGLTLINGISGRIRTTICAPAAAENDNAIAIIITIFTMNFFIRMFFRKTPIKEEGLIRGKRNWQLAMGNRQKKAV